MASIPPEAGSSPILEMVSACAAAQPDAPAIFELDGTVTSYGELWQRAEQLAHGLSIEPGEIVGVCLPRSGELVVAMMAVMMQGGVYSPFSPDDPELRTEDLQSRIGIRTVIESDGSRMVVRLRDVSRGTALDVTGDPRDRPIYVMCTSGSTGEPKAVVIPQRGVVRLVRDRTLMEIRADDRLAFASNQMFDAATWEIWASLCNGAGLVVIGPGDLVDAQRLRVRFEQTGVTLAFITTALFNHLVRSDPGLFGSLTSVAVGGEPLGPAYIRSVLESSTPPTNLLNVYGPTECTVFAASNRIRHVPVDAVRIPVGGPILETELAVVDTDGRPVGPGIDGELWIAGDGVALEYLGSPPESIRFVDTTLPGFAGNRWFRTGDLVRSDPDGSLDCLGRIDRQLKINGHRVEPGEVEQAITSRPGVAAAAVIAHRSGSSVRLIGFVVRDGHDFDAHSILESLTDILPAYMVPARLVQIEQIPITANGKTDEPFLQDLARQTPVSEGTGSEAGRDRPVRLLNPIERFVLDCASTILGVDSLGVDDDLWWSGMDSLAAIELLDMINEGGFGRFDDPDFRGLSTAAAIADHLQHATNDSVDAGVTTSTMILNPNGSAAPIFAIPGGGESANRFRPLARTLDPDQPVVVIGPRGMHVPGPADRTIGELAAHVVSEVDLHVDRSSPCVIIGYSSGASIAFEAALQLEENGLDVRLVMIDGLPGLTNLPRIRESSGESLPIFWRFRRIKRKAAARRNRKRIDRLVADLGAPSFDVTRYKAFAVIQARAIEAYTPRPAPFAATLIRVDGPSVDRYLIELFPTFDIHVVGGNHATVLTPAHVGEIADILTPLLFDASGQTHDTPPD